MTGRWVELALPSVMINGILHRKYRHLQSGSVGHREDGIHQCGGPTVQVSSLPIQLYC